MRFPTYLAVLLLIVACGAEGDESEVETTTSTSDTITTAQGTTTSEFSTNASLPEGFPAALLEEIVADTVDRTDVLVSDVEVTSIDAMTFNDASLGCPEPGKMYAQVLTSGFIVLVDADGAELDYRVAEGSDFFRMCE